VAPFPLLVRLAGSRSPGERTGVSELYASLLMIGVTLSFGSLVTSAAVSQLSSAVGSSSLGASVMGASAGKEIALVYATVGSTAGCQPYRGASEGTSLTVVLYDYGTTPFTPAELVDNSTIYTGSYPTLAAGSLSSYTLALGSCAHSSGQSLLAVDPFGDEVQIGT